MAGIVLEQFYMCNFKVGHVSLQESSFSTVFIP